jgi:TIR domain-containing protein
MRIFVSYSFDGKDIAEAIHTTYKPQGHSVFISSREIQLGERWANTISENIAVCDLFLVIVTRGALISAYVEKEVTEAKNHNRKIVPCRYFEIGWDELKWGMEEMEGLDFDVHPQPLIRRLDGRIRPYSPPETSTTNTNLSNNLGVSQ